MLLSVDLKTRTAERLRGVALKEFDLDERALQDILFRSLDRLLPDDELLVIWQSRRGPEEPDLMALDADGKLYIFELKIWESKSYNLLQVFRYGQIFGSHGYEDLDRMFRKGRGASFDLSAAHHQKFYREIAKEQFNRDQVFVVMTNGIDTKTREAIRYWRSKQLEVRPWIYRVYKTDFSKHMTVEISPFRVEDNPYEDSDGGFFVLNTNFSNDPADHEDMIRHKKAAAYSDPWKYKIEQIGRGDFVFLYKSGTGIVAFGTASGKVEKSPHQDGEGPEDQYSMRLDKFHELGTPIPAAEIKEVTGNNYVFMGTMFAMDKEAGRKLLQVADSRRA